MKTILFLSTPIFLLFLVSCSELLIKNNDFQQRSKIYTVTSDTEKESVLEEIRNKKDRPSINKINQYSFDGKTEKTESNIIIKY